MVERVCGTPVGDVPGSRQDAGGGLGARPHGGDLLRGRLDPAHDRRPDDPRVDDLAVAARQHRPAGRRHPRAPRARVDPGVDRHPHALQPPARLPQHAERVEGARHAGRLHRHRDQPDELLGPLPQVHGQPAQGLVRRGGHEGERLRLRLAPQDRGRPLAHADVRRHGRGEDQGPHGDGPEPGRRRPERRLSAPGAGEARLAGRPRPVRDRDRHVLEGQPRGRRGRPEARGDRHRGLPPARGRHRRDGRDLHQHPAPPAMARPRGRPARRRAVRPLVHRPARPPAQAALRGEQAASATGRSRRSSGTTSTPRRTPGGGSRTSRPPPGSSRR